MSEQEDVSKVQKRVEGERSDYLKILCLQGWKWEDLLSTGDGSVADGSIVPGSVLCILSAESELAQSTALQHIASKI